MDDRARITELLERIRPEFPPSPRVNRFELEIRNDSVGDPAVFIWVLFDDQTPESEQTLANVEPIEERIFDALRDAGETRWPFIRFRTESEYRDMVEA